MFEDLEKEENQKNDEQEQQNLYSQISVNKHVLEEPIWETVVSILVKL